VVLDVVCMIGDIIFALLAFPIRIVSSWWKKSIFNREANLESETESLPEERNNVHPDVNHLYAGVPGQAQPNVVQFPRKVNSDPSRPGHSRNPSTESGRSATQDSRAQKGAGAQRIPSNGNGIPNGLYSYQIWHPPPSSYSDADEDSATGPILNTPPPRHNSDEDSDVLARMEEAARQQIDEWRQYPPFPSAYPPTPIVTASSKLPSNPSRPPKRPPDTVLTEITEDEPQQDFRGSLLPPRKPLNPSHVGLSDDYLTTHPGVQINRLVDDEMTVDTDSDMVDEEDEDEFNTTLRTPLPPQGSARSRVRDPVATNRPISMASSVTSKSTALTTAGGSSSLRTRSSSESLLSAAMSMISSTDSSSVVGKKRPLPQSRAVIVKNKGQVINGTAARSTPRRRGILNLPAHRLSHTRRVVRHERVVIASETVSEETTSSVGEVDEQKGHTTKRRKIALPPGHATPTSRPIRRRITRYATPPARAAAQTRRNTVIAPSAPSAPIRSGLIVRPKPVKRTDITQPNSSHDPAPERRTRSHGRNAID
jgi:hypothetical protein